MAVGLHASRSDIDNRAGGLPRDLKNIFDQIQQFQAFLAATPDATLLAAPYGYTQGEVNTMKSAFTDLDKLRTIYQGGVAQTPAYDFRTFSKLLFDF